MKSRLSIMGLVIMVASSFNSCSAFSATTTRGHNNPSSSSSALRMAPRYDPETKRWQATTPEDSEGYPPVGSLLRQGPTPFLQRLTNADEYEQGVLKMMAKEGMSRMEAQGNMDAYLRNPNDWALQKVEEKNGAPKFDYANANMDGQDLALTGVWASILLTIVGRIVYVGANGCDAFCQANHF